MSQSNVNLLSAAGAAAAAAPAGLSSLEQAKAEFLSADYSSSYGYQGWLDKHWWAEVGVRFGPGQHYLDYTGALACMRSLACAALHAGWLCFSPCLHTRRCYSFTA
jgi:hypothetical protein